MKYASFTLIASLISLAQGKGTLRQQFFQIFHNIVEPSSYLSSSNYHKLLQCDYDNSSQLDNINNLDVWREDSLNKHFIVRVRDSFEFNQLDKLFNCKVIIDDIQTHFNLTAQLQPHEELETYDFDKSSEDLLDKNKFFKKYHSYNTYLQLIFHWSEKFPKYVELDTDIGTTIEGRELIGVRISNFRLRNLKQKIWFNSGQHAREWVGPASQFFIMNHLLSLADEDDHIATLLSSFEFIFTPFSNPDGFEYSRTKDRFWRKNRRYNYDGSYGVDLNRNWDDHWNVVGGSKDPEDETYVGIGPFSEPETKALSEYILAQGDIIAGIDFHSYGQLILRNWGWTMQEALYDEEHLQLSKSIELGFKGKGYKFVSLHSAGLYPAGGALDDWMASKGKMVSFTIELCPDDDKIGFLLPEKQLLHCSQAAWNGILGFSKHLLNHWVPPNPPIDE